MPTHRRSALTLLFATTLFVSAALLFWVEPMVAKMLVPLLGGTPSVWNTCLVFFQAMLLAGYAYALYVSTRFSFRQQAFIQLALLIITIFALPVWISAHTIESVPHNNNPTLWLLGSLLAAVGLPFFTVSTSGPLLQKWFAQTHHTDASDPYFLYAASNAGSLIALIAYPFIFEPRLSLHQQSWLWTCFYGALVLLSMLCAFVLFTRSRATRTETDQTKDASLSHIRRLHWVLLAFVPSSLMLGVTTYISTDIASLPLLWIIPLSLYLLTLILAFARRQLITWRFMSRILPGAAILLVLVYLSGATQPALFIVFLHLFFFFVAALNCHGRLASDRPSTAHLAEFYLWMSVGGVAGGIFNALIAPLAFHTVIEYPLMIVVVCLLRPRAAVEVEKTTRTRLLDVGFAASILLLTLMLALIVRRFEFDQMQSAAVVFGVPLLVGYVFKQHRLRFALTLAAVMLGSVFYSNLNSHTIYVARNFFGVVRVTRDDANAQHWLYNGSTIHGRQFTAPERQCEPLSYYHRAGPLAQILNTFDAHPASTNVAIVGLGTGATITYAHAQEHWTFYEINPAVVSIARDPNSFTYLTNCAAAPVEIVLGDARLQLREAADAHYGLIVLDAFSSDAIPIHLMTVEALDLYLAKLAPDGLLVFHISNRSLDLHPIVAALAQSRHLACVAFDDVGQTQVEGKEPSQWIAVARRTDDLGKLTSDAAHWHTLKARASDKLWTDDFSDIISILKWH